jgi:hypothetical protein
MVEQQQGVMAEPGKRPNPLNLTESTSSTLLDPVAGSLGYDSVLTGGPLTPMLGSVVPTELNVDGLDEEETEELKNDTVPMPDKK